MGDIKHKRPRPRWATLRVGDIAVAMTVAMASGLVVGLIATEIDSSWLWPPPVAFGNVAGARVMLGSIIAGLITVSVFGLWMRTVVVGLMAANFSPRTLLIFLDDKFQRHLLAFMSAGVVAVMVILLRMPYNEEAPVPLVSTMLAVLIVLTAVSGVLLAIQHATRSLSLPELVTRLADDAIGVLDRHPKTRIDLAEAPPPMVAPQTVLAAETGWVTSIDIDQVREALPAGGVAYLRCRVGEFVSPRWAVALVCLTEADEEADLDALARAVNVARTRSPDMDLAFSVSQLVDVGAFALQERGDTATAHEVMVHLEVVLAEIVDRGLPRLHDADDDGRYVYDEVSWNPVDLVRLCVERLREPAARDPEAAKHLMQMLHRVRAVARERSASAVVSEIERQVEMLLTLAEADGMLARDRQRLMQEAEAIINDV